MKVIMHKKMVSIMIMDPTQKTMREALRKITTLLTNLMMTIRLLMSKQSLTKTN